MVITVSLLDLVLFWHQWPIITTWFFLIYFLILVDIIKANHKRLLEFLRHLRSFNFWSLVILAYLLLILLLALASIISTRYFYLFFRVKLILILNWPVFLSETDRAGAINYFLTTGVWAALLPSHFIWGATWYDFGLFYGLWCLFELLFVFLLFT